MSSETPSCENTTEALEPITLIFPALNRSVELSPEAVALVWNAVKRGAASSAEEYVNRVFREYFERLTAAPEEAANPAAKSE
jgi:hypothetical protein